MTTIYTTFVYLNDIDTTIEDGSGYGKYFVKLLESLPVRRHSSLKVSVHSIDIPIPNKSGSYFPRKIRVKCSTPSLAQDPKTYNNTLLQLYTGQHFTQLPGDFSLISFRDSTSSGTAVQVLDGHLQSFDIYLTDSQDNTYIPLLPFDLVLKIEVIRNYEAEHLEQLNKLVSSQNLLLLHNNLTNPLEQTEEQRSETYQTAGDLYGPVSEDTA